jgi:hypothetical protein
MNEIDILEQQAVDASINQQWDVAVEINKQILVMDDQNISAYLRLGFAELQKEDAKEAKKYYDAVLKLQPHNQMAIDNLERIEILLDTSTKKSVKEKAHLDPNMFLEIPGKTKSVPLVKLGQKNVLAVLAVGQEIELKLKARKVEIRSKDDEYIGSLPDDLSKRLIFFLKNKSSYRAYIKESNLSRVVIFIQEEKKGKKVAHYSSFPATIQPTPTIENEDDDEANPNDLELEDEGEDNIFGEEDDLAKMAEELDPEDKDLLQIRSEEEPEDEEE